MNFKNVTKLEHPILMHKLGYLRDKDTTSQVFRGVLQELTLFLAYEAMRDYQTEKVQIETPMAKTQVERVTKPPLFVSIMRAGNTMLETLLDTFPFGSAGHIGIYRDKFINNTVEYYFKMPKDHHGSNVFLLDPLIATGDTMIAAIDRLKQYKVGKIRILTIITNKTAIEKINYFHPDVEMFVIAIDPEVTDKGYLVPGIGDAGNRLYKTL